MKSQHLLTQALRTLVTRPFQFLASVRAYSLFRIKSPLSRLFFTEASGVKLGKNVRLQKLSCLSAERPGASVSIGDHSVIYEHAQIAAYGEGKLLIGERAVVGDVRIYARERVQIGARAVFSWNVFIQDFQPHPLEPELRAEQMVTLTDYFAPSFDRETVRKPRFAWKFPTQAVEVGDDVWFGANCTVLPGAKIGSGCVVAAGAVVTRGEYPARSILAGNPARVVKTMPEASQKMMAEAVR